MSLSIFPSITALRCPGDHTIDFETMECVPLDPCEDPIQACGDGVLSCQTDANDKICICKSGYVVNTQSPTQCLEFSCPIGQVPECDFQTATDDTSVCSCVCENSTTFQSSGDQCLRQCEDNCPKGTYCDAANLQADQLKYKHLLPFDQEKYCKCNDENKELRGNECVCKEGFLANSGQCYENKCEVDCGKGSCEFNGIDEFECKCEKFAYPTGNGCVHPTCGKGENFIDGKCVRHCRDNNEDCPENAKCLPDVIALKGKTVKDFCECPSSFVMSKIDEELGMIAEIC